MNESIRYGKRAFAIATAVATILWSIGFSAFVAPLTADAQAVQAGDVIKGTTLSTVYYYASDGQRYAYPNLKTYMTWHSDFSGVETISDSELAAIPLGGNIVNRPGSYWVKIQSDPKTYAVTPDGQIRWIESESVAEGLAGSDWNQHIVDVPDVFFTDYTVGASLTSAASAYNGALVDDNGTTYLIWNGEKRMVTSAGFSANRFQSRFLLDGDGIDLSGIPSGSDITGEVAELTDDAQMGGVTQTTGGLNIRLASDTPAAMTIPGGAASAEFTKVQLTASSGSADVSGMKFHLGGIGSTGNIDNAYLYEGSKRLTDARSVNSTTRLVTFSALGISLGSGQSKYLTVRADVNSSPSAGDTANFGVRSASDVTSTATVSGNFPVRGNNMTFSGTSAGTVTISTGGSVSNPTIGEKGATIAKFDLQPSSEDGSLEEITLDIDNAADHSNYALYQSSTKLADGEYVRGDLVNFVLSNPFMVDDGNTKKFEVRADIGGQADDTVLVHLNEIADLVMVGSDFGYNMAVTNNYGASSSCGNCTSSTIQGGDLTFAFNGPAAGDIQVDGDNEVLNEFTVTTQNWIEIKDMKVKFEAPNGDSAVDDGDLLNDTQSDANLTDLTIRKMDGTTWMGPKELSTTNASSSSTDDTSQTLQFTDNQILQAGESVDLMVTADVSSNATDGDDVRASILDPSSSSNVTAEDINGDALGTSDITPSADLTGNNQTINAAQLDVTLAQPPSSGTFVKGTSNVDVVGHSFKAGDTSDINVTDVTMTVAGEDNADADFTADSNLTDAQLRSRVSACSLYDSESGALVDGPEGLESGTNSAGIEDILFQNFDWLIPAGETKKLLTRCNFANTSLVSSNNDSYAFYIDANTDVTGEDEDGDQVNADSGTFSSNALGNTTSVFHTIKNKGTIAVALDGSSPSSTIVLGSSTGVKASVYKFTTTDEAVLVKDLRIANGGNDRAIGAVKLSYKNKAGDTVTKTAFLSSGNADFSGLDFYIPANANRMLTVNVDTNSVSSTGATSGDNINLDFNDEQFDAVGQGSGESFSASDVVDVTTNVGNHELRKTKPTLSLHASSPSGGAVPSFDEVLRFNVAADSRGYITLDEIMFQVSSTDGGASGWNDCDTDDTTELAQASKWTLYDVDDPSDELDDDADWTFYGDDGDDTACTTTSTDNLTFAHLDFNGAGSDPEEIGAGETKTYVLEVDTSGASTTDDDSFRVDIPRESTVDGNDDLATAAEVAIQWDDDSEGTDIDGDYVKNLPVRGGTLIY